jgi:putative hemolysin
MRRFGPAAMMTLGMGLTLAACSNPAGVDTGNHGTAQIRLMNAAVGGPTLDLLIGGTVITSGVAQGQTSAFATLPGGNQTLTVRQAGQTLTLASRSVDFTPNGRYALVVSGTVASLMLTPALTPSVALDTGLAKPDKANIRIININQIGDAPSDSSHAPAPIPLDVYITAPGADLSALSPNFSMDARYSSYSSLLYFPPADWVVQFTTAGSKLPVAVTATIPIAEGEVRAVTLQRTAAGGFTTSVVTEN